MEISGDKWPANLELASASTRVDLEPRIAQSPIEPRRTILFIELLPLLAVGRGDRRQREVPAQRAAARLTSGSLHPPPPLLSRQPSRTLHISEPEGSENSCYILPFFSLVFMSLLMAIGRRRRQPPHRKR